MLRFPQVELTRDQKEALSGTFGEPAVDNKYVTEDDPKFNPATQATTGLMSAQDKTKLDNLSTSLGEPSVINAVDKFQMMNMFRALFDANSEVVLLPELVPNIVRFDLFQDNSKIETLTNTVLMGGSVRLGIQGSTTLWDGCENLTSPEGTSWISYNSGSGSTSIESSTEWSTQGSRSFKLNINCRAYHDQYAAETTWTTTRNWGGYSAIMVDLNSQIDQIQALLQIRNNTTWQGLSYLSIDDSDFNKNVIIPIVGTRTAVRGIRIGFYNIDFIGPGFGYIDNIRLVSGSLDYHASGSVVTTTRTSPTPITDLLVTDKRIFPTNTGSMSLDVSLDGGLHWKSNVSTNTILGTANSFDPLFRADGNVPWTNRVGLKLRYNFVRGSDGESPRLDDYATIISRE